MTRRELLNAAGSCPGLPLTGEALADDARTPLVRIAELQIDPARLESFEVSIREEMAASARIEPRLLGDRRGGGEGRPTRLRFFDIDADEAAYRSHRETTYFKKYVGTTRDMTRSRRLIETVPIQRSVKNG